MAAIISNIKLSTETLNYIIKLDNTKDDMISSYVGLAFGCVFAVVLMVISCVLFVRELNTSSKDELPSSVSRNSNDHSHQPVKSQLSTNPVATITPPTVKIITTNESVCIQTVCIEFLQTLNLSEEYFDKKYNCCYCSRHYPLNKPKTYNCGGHVYTIPCGWMRFGLKFYKPLGENENIFQTWATSFYGTSVNQLESILRNRFIPFPGDRLLNNEIFLPKHNDQKHCYTSPSIYYTSHLKVCEKYFFTSSTNETYQVQVALQCKQKPSIFEVTYSPINVCNLIPANEIKWKTSTRSTIIPYGLVVHVVKQ